MTHSTVPCGRKHSAGKTCADGWFCDQCQEIVELRKWKQQAIIMGQSGDFDGLAKLLGLEDEPEPG